jgi:hypothetical protein
MPQAILVPDWLISKKSSLKRGQSETIIAYGGHVC